MQLEDIIDLIEDALNSGKTFKFSPRGTSMLPLFRSNKDQVVLSKRNQRYKKYDIIFYKREDGSFILHRIIKVKKDSYVLCGDNQVSKEHGITDNQVIGYVISFNKNNKEYSIKNIKYRIYSFIRVKTIFIRRVLIFIFKKRKS